ETCNADSECNGPFGKCVVTPVSPGYCQCIWGFSGTYCKSPWLFVFVIVGGSLLLIAVALVIFLCVSSSKKGKKVKSKVSKHAENGTLHENPFYDSKGNMPESTENILNTFNYKFNGNMRATVPSNLNTDDDNYKRRSHAPSERAGLKCKRQQKLCS
uniref:EGF-like domain-containing protein n=1 Tax=Ciona savignyi TaxID=51511 RepID=H2ZDQ2_CIOSA